MAGKKNVDWNAVKNAYISDSEKSFRSLAADFGVSVSAIHRRAKEGGWAEKRERFAHKTETLTLEKLAAKRAAGEAKRLKLLYDANDKLAQKVFDGIKKVDPKNTLAIRQLTSSLRELLGIEGVVAVERKLGDEEETGGVVILADVTEKPEPPSDMQDGEEEKAVTYE
jgi:hypothetical protein